MLAQMGSPSPAPPRWVILRRVPQVCHDLGADFSLTLVEPPHLTELAVSPHLTPDGVSVDCFPLVHAADPSGILLVSATYGRSMGPPSADKQAGNYTTNYFVWNAAIDYTHRLPPHEDSVKHTGNVGLVVAPRSGDEYNFMVAELLPAGDRASLLCYWSYSREWVKKMLPFPLKCPWYSARTFSYQGKLWWLDLSQGLLCCDPFAEEPELLFMPLPDDIHTRGRDVSKHRCVNLSNGALWLAEMTYHRRVLFVKMWKLGAQGQWTPDYTFKFADIWADRSYKETRLPKKKPALVGINPDDPEVLYFVLGGNLLEVNMCAKRVELCVAFSPTTNLKIDQGSSQFILTWNLPTSIVSSSGDTNVCFCKLLGITCYRLSYCVALLN